MLHKYIGNEGQAPRLSKMGGSDWSRTQKRAQAAITILAEELLRLYAQRKIVPGHAFSPDTEWQKEFEEKFPYEETPDQLKAIAEIKPIWKSRCRWTGFYAATLVTENGSCHTCGV